MDKYIKIRAWSSNDGYWIGTDKRLQKTMYFNKYGFIAKLSYFYLKTFYQKVVIETSNTNKWGE